MSGPSDPFDPAFQSAADRLPQQKIVLLFVFIALVIALAIGAGIAYLILSSHHAPPLAPLPVHQLAAKYVDTQDRLVADAPSNPKQWLDPDSLVLAAEPAEGKPRPVDWDALRDQLAKATGKKVDVEMLHGNSDDASAIAGGRIQIAAVDGADVPYLVNNAGFVPIGLLSGETGTFGDHLVFVIPAKSPMQTIRDLRGHTLTCVSPDSAFGFRLATIILQQETGLIRDVDYFVKFSDDEGKTLHGIANGEIEAAVLPNEHIKPLMKKEKLRRSKFRVIYESETIPQITIGTVYNLKPELAAKIKQAVLDFKNEGATEKVNGKPMQFVNVDYKKDFDLERKIDGSFESRLADKTAANSPPAKE
jgi:phosphonate transport system substrate-binding protein